MSRFAITFGEVAILHIGSNELGKIRENGFSVKELKNIKKKIGKQAKLIKLSKELPKEIRKENDAAVLVIKNGADLFLGKGYADKLLNEQLKVEYDKKYYDIRTKKTKNKRARYNIVFGEENIKASEDYKIYTVKSFKSLKYLNKFRKSLPNFLGDKAVNLNAEGNYYYEKKSGIGYHGDAERKIVICLSLGSSSTLRYVWRMPNSSEKYGNSIDIKVNHGDIYIMSEKATGNDWKKRSKVRIVHGAGSDKYIKTQ